jgi:RimJ/RimL family protein N-acetyltransferase
LNPPAVKLQIYNLKSSSADFPEGKVTLPPGYEIRFWKPTWRNFIPPKKDRKYLLYWLFHQSGLFKNKSYSGLFVYHDQQIVCSLLIVPAHYKWPFMGKHDVQFTYVMTHRAHRGKGIAAEAIKHALGVMKAEGRTFWYVTESGNEASVKLCTRLKFRLFGYADSGSFLKVVNVTSLP